MKWISHCEIVDGVDGVTEHGNNKVTTTAAGALTWSGRVIVASFG